MSRKPDIMSNAVMQKHMRSQTSLVVHNIAITPNSGILTVVGDQLVHFELCYERHGLFLIPNP